jgi:hypothetical protein
MGSLLKIFIDDENAVIQFNALNHKQARFPKVLERSYETNK